jgi:hypothetical protein
MVDPAISRKRRIVGVAFRSGVGLAVVEIEPLRTDLELIELTTATSDVIANGVITGARSATLATRRRSASGRVPAKSV